MKNLNFSVRSIFEEEGLPEAGLVYNIDSSDLKSSVTLNSLSFQLQKTLPSFSLQKFMILSL